MAQHESKKLGSAVNLISSIAASVMHVTAVAPLERIKLLVQSQGEMLKTGRLSEPYKGVIDCTVRTYRTEGILPFWRGNLASCLLSFPTHALNFAFNEKLKTVYKKNETDTHTVTFIKNVASGGSSGALSLVFVYSLGYTRTRLANDVRTIGKGSERQFKGIIDVYRKTLKSDGIRGLYRGFGVACVGVVVYRGFYFGLYDTLTPLLLGKDSGFISSFGLAYLVTVIAGLASYPLDTVVRRMMMTSGEPVKYRGSIDCFTQIVKNEGPLSLMKGVSVALLRGVAGAALLAGYNSLKAFFTAWRPS